MSLYHFKIGFPKKVIRVSGVIDLTYSRHALAARVGEKYGIPVLPEKLDVENAQLIELEVEGNQVVKSVYRISLNYLHDLVLVVGRDGYVRTVWVNLKSDTHRSLDHSKYRRP